MEILFPFRHKPVLFLLLIPALLLYWVWNRSGNNVVLPFDHGEKPRGAWLRFFVNLGESIPSLILALVILIMAGPQRWDEPRSQKVLTNIEFCVDVSGSMTASFGDGDRYDAAMRAINDFIDYREGDAFGLTFFGVSVLHWVPLTTDVSAFRCAPPFMRPGHIPSWFNGTAIGKALLACRRVLASREKGDRLIVLISDGNSSDLGGGRDEEVIKFLKRDNITVYAVHISNSEPADTIVNITSMTGGEVFHVDDPGGLGRVFERIDEMQETEIERARAEAVDDYWIWSTVGLALLGTLLLGMFGLRYTPW